MPTAGWIPSIPARHLGRLSGGAAPALHVPLVLPKLGWQGEGGLCPFGDSMCPGWALLAPVVAWPP